MQPAESLTSSDATGDQRTNSARRCFLSQSEMSSVFVVVRDIIGKQSTKMGLFQSHPVIQQVPAAALDPTLCNAILPRTLEGSADTLDFHRPNRSRNFRPVLGIPIEDEKPGSGPIGEGLPQLLYNPQTGGMPRHMEM